MIIISYPCYLSLDEYFDFRDKCEEWMSNYLNEDDYWPGYTKCGFKNEDDATAFKLKFGL